MIKVTIISEKAVVESIAGSSGENIRVAWAQENEKNSGYCVFDESGEIISVKDNDDVFELLIRSVLNHLDLLGVKTAVCKNEELKNELKKLGFTVTENGCETDIKAFFKPCCSR